MAADIKLRPTDDDLSILSPIRGMALSLGAKFWIGIGGRELAEGAFAGSAVIGGHVRDDGMATNQSRCEMNARASVARGVARS